MRKIWKVNPANKELQEEFSRELEILPLTAQLLINRGLVSIDKAFSFLRPDLTGLHDPFLMKDMKRAVGRLVLALNNNEKIAVYGDYDVDDTTASALLYHFLSEVGSEPVCYIPNRLTEGYGLNNDALKKLSDEGAKVVITADCGIANRAEVRFARSLGLDVIVTDHHEVPDDPPEACAVINPRQKGCGFPFKGLAGVGVAFNLVVALRAALREAGWFKDAVPNLKRYLDLVCIGTVADMVPLVDENRVFVSFGLKELESSRRAGLVALKEAAGLKSANLSAYNIGFQLAPRINAAGRLHDASAAFKLLTTDDTEEAVRLAGMLDSENSDRQRIEAEILKQALDMLKDLKDEKAIVLFSEGWHPGVIGIVASRLVDRFFRPAVMIAVEGDIGKGSARGIKSFDVLEGLKNCSEYLDRYGGHKAAAGLTLRKENLKGFKDSFLGYINNTLTREDLVKEVELDAVVGLGELNLRALLEIERLSPFGTANREPLLCIKGADIVATEIVGSRHLKIRVKHHDSSTSAIGFGLAELHPLSGCGFDIAFHPYLDDWQGVKNLGLRVKDIQPTGENPRDTN